jgi:hypothetical protein
MVAPADIECVERHGELNVQVANDQVAALLLAVNDDSKWDDHHEARILNEGDSLVLHSDAFFQRLQQESKEDALLNIEGHSHEANPLDNFVGLP